MKIRSKTQRTFLIAFVGSITACALIGIWCLIIGGMGRTEEKILATTAVVAAVSVLSLACAASMEFGRWRWIGLAGLIAAAATFVITLVEIWFSYLEYKLMGVAWVLAVALPVIGLVLLARLHRKWGGVRLATIALLALLASQIILTIVFDLFSDEWGRFVGVVAIAATCGVIVVPILHRVSAIRTREEVRTVELMIALSCPRCGKAQELPAGRSACGGCGLRFQIEIDEEHCRKCGYVLYQLQSAVCPECGTPIALENAAGAGAGAG